MPQVLTLKQAKAAHRKRNSTTVTPAQLRQYERQAQLDRRAWGVQKREEDRRQAEQKRKEKEERQRAAERNAIQGSRRLDKSGHLSSQFHLGAFFGVRTAPRQPEIPVDLSMTDPDDEIFGCSLPDREFLNVCADEFNEPQHAYKCEAEEADTDVKESLPLKHIDLPLTLDGACDWDDFCDTGTQIARELDDDEPVIAPRKRSLTPTKSFSNSFDMSLSSQDFEVAMEAAIVEIEAGKKKENDRERMPPPALPGIQKTDLGTKLQQSNACVEDMSMRKRTDHNVIPLASKTIMRDIIITPSQLEVFAEDFSLTQACQ